MTRSTRCSGLMRLGSPPIARMASRMLARSTTTGTPVKSCRSTRAGVNAISRSSPAFGVQLARATTSSLRDGVPVFLPQQVFEQNLRAKTGAARCAPRSSLRVRRGGGTGSYQPAVCSVARLPKLFEVMHYPLSHQGCGPGSPGHSDESGVCRPSDDSNRAGRTRSHFPSLLPRSVAVLGPSPAAQQRASRCRCRLNRAPATSSRAEDRWARGRLLGGTNYRSIRPRRCLWAPIRPNRASAVKIAARIPELRYNRCWWGPVA